jgi:phosphatidate cytidylyltransferase
MSSEAIRRRAHVNRQNSSLSDLSDFDDEKEPKAKAASPVTLNKVLTRTVAACVLIAFYMLVLRAGHLYCVVCVILTQIELFRELVNVRYVEAKEKRMPLFRSIQWGWFFVAMLYVCKYTDPNNLRLVLYI